MLVGEALGHLQDIYAYTLVHTVISEILVRQ